MKKHIFFILNKKIFKILKNMIYIVFLNTSKMKVQGYYHQV